MNNSYNCSDVYDIIIVAGQSNAEGFGIGPVDKEYEVDDNILCMTSEVSDVMDGDERIITYPNKTLAINVAKERITEKGKTGNLGLIFAKEYMKYNLLANGRKILIIKAALGGTGFYRKQWGEGCPVEKRMHEMIEYALSLNEENKIVAFLWHQGEHDAFEGTAPENYKKELYRLMNLVRAKYHCVDVPFVAGDFCNEWKSKNMETCEPIVNKIREVFSSEKYGFVETTDLLSNNQKSSNGDDIHFCRESLYILGRRYFQEYCKILGIFILTI